MNKTTQLSVFLIAIARENHEKDDLEKKVTQEAFHPFFLL